MSDVKFCKDCRHIVVTDGRMGFAKCALFVNKSNPEYLVMGDDPSAMAYCSTQRITVCGPEGKLWEPAA